MKLRNLTAVGALAAVALFACASQAGPLQRAHVPAEPAWVVHVDCDRIQGTKLGQWILSELEKPEAQAKLAAFQAVFNFDLRRQLHGLTLYSASSNPVDGVLVVYADVDSQRLTTLAQGAHEHQSTAHKDHTIHSWVDQNKKAKDGVRPRTYAAIYGSRVVFGQRASTVGAALDVLDGASPTLANSPNLAQLGAPASTTFIQAVARKMDMPENDPNAAVFRLSQVIRLDIAEAQEQVRAILTLEAVNAEVAHQISSILQGVIALMKFQAAKPETARFAEFLSVSEEASSVTVRMEMPASQAIELLKADAARKADADKTKASQKPK